MTIKHSTSCVALRAVIASALCAMAVSSLAVAFNADAQTAGDDDCPAGYWKLDNVWSDDKGNVEQAIGQSAQQVASKRGGSVQNWQLGALCMVVSTGDVRIFDISPSTTAGSATASR